MKVKATRFFHDASEDVIRQSGETFEVTQERFDEINGAGHGVLVKRVSQPRKKKADDADCADGAEKAE